MRGGLQCAKFLRSKPLRSFVETAAKLRPRSTMKLSRYLGFVLVSLALTAACGNRQQTQSLTPTAQPLVSDKPSPLQPGASAQPSQAPAVPQPAYHYERAGTAPVPAAAAAAPAERLPATVSIPAGTPIDVRLMETIDTKRNRSGDRFDATLTKAIALDGETIVPRGTRFAGHLIESQSSGRLKGHAELSLSLDSFELNGRRYDIKTTHVARASGGHKKRNWTLIGGGSGLGAALGAIAGGPSGALIGAGAGAGAGTAGAVFTGKKNVTLPVETPLAFTLREPVALPR